MWAATAWDDAGWPAGAEARGWTVMGRLYKRQAVLRRGADEARRRDGNEGPPRSVSMKRVRASATPGGWHRLMRSYWVGGPTVVALLFAHPDSRAIRMLDARGGYFDHRTAETWDLFFPGYHRSDDGYMERQAGGRPVGRAFAEDWFFNSRDFDAFRRHVEDASGGRWRYSGGTDLVVMTGYVPDEGDIIIDWQSTFTGSLTEPDGTQTLTVAQVIERLSTDLETDAEDPAYGLAEVARRAVAESDRSAARDVTVGALGGIAAAMARAGLGL